jgi:CubicO group peptidase (beta-lactamase class C family)
MRAILLAQFVLGVVSAPALSLAQQRSAPQELPTKWEVPPGDGVEHALAGFAKILCAAVFITGRPLAAAADEDGHFVVTAAERRLAKDTVVDHARQSVTVTTPNGTKRTARRFADQGCITLPPGRDSVFFKPVKVTSALPNPATTPWPMGDLLPNEALPKEIDKAKLDEAVAAAFDSGLTAAFVVTYKGRIVGERYGPGITATTRLPSWSMGKSLTATLIGQLIQQGVYDLWAPAPVDEWQKPNDVRRTIRIGDLLRMSSGLRFIAPQDPGFDRSRGYPDHLYVYTGAVDAHRWAVTRPSQWRPNTIGRYRNSDPLTLNYLVKKAALAKGEEYLSYPQRRLFDKLGIQNMTLETDPYGNFLLQGYELGTGRDWTRLALLYLNGGMWNGERILPSAFVDFVRTPAPAWEQPIYGGMFWLNRLKTFPIPEDAYYMAGAGGQSTIIIPTHDMTVVRIGHYKGAEAGDATLGKSLTLLMQAVPQVRAPWQPPR